LSCSFDGIIQAWNFKPNSRPFKFVGHKSAVHEIAYHPTGKYIASASQDETIILWTNAVNYTRDLIKSHSAPVRTVCFNSDGQYLLSGSDDKTLKIWSLGEKMMKGKDRLIPEFKTSISAHANWIRTA